MRDIDTDTDITASIAIDGPPSRTPRTSPPRVRRERPRVGGAPAARVLEDPIEDDEGIDLAEIRARESRSRRLLVLADVLAASLSLLLCVNVFGDDYARAPMLAAIPLVILASKLKGLYDRDELLVKKTTIDEIPKLFQLATLYTLLVTVLQHPLLDGHLGGGQILVLWVALLALTAGLRHVARFVARRTTSLERCLFVGSQGSFERLEDKLTQGGNGKLVGRMVIDPHAAGQTANVARLHALIQRHRVHRVIVEPSDVTPQLTLDFVREAKATGVRVSVLPRILEVVGSAIEVDDVDGLTLLGVRKFGLSRSSALVKRSFDAAGAAALLLVLAPLFAVAAVAIKLGSRGPVFYRAARVGRHGETFQMWKFRSMVTGADAQRAQLAAQNEAAEGLFKIADDPRITRIGSVLRKSSIDELPQLFNVLRGEMSLVGPRPLVADEDAQIMGLDRRRLHLTPGMTGPWQVLGSSRVPLAEMVKLDYLYVAGWSLWNDVKILLRTAGFVLARRGL